MSLVLIVEDEYGTAEVLSLILQAEGFSAALASNGRDALLRINEARPDIIVSDYMMPVMDGAQLGLAVRADPALRALPFVMTSALEERRIRHVFADYDAFLQKPYTAEALIHTIKELVKGRPAVAQPPATLRRTSAVIGRPAPGSAPPGLWLVRALGL
jgi:two-component system phosphate regulon response regulator PhoB